MKLTQKFISLLCLLVCLLQLPCFADDGIELLDLDDGSYAIEVYLQGGSGKASIVSPAPLTVIDGMGYATLQWSSSNYDYMIVGGEKYLPINEGGSSTFEVPILRYDEGYKVIADTTAMGTPHEVEYTLTFPHSGIMGASETPQARARFSVYIALGIVVLCIFVSFMQKQDQKRKQRALSRRRKSA